MKTTRCTGTEAKIALAAQEDERYSEPAGTAARSSGRRVRTDVPIPDPRSGEREWWMIFRSMRCSGS